MARAVDRHLSEPIIYGGLLATRGEAYALALAETGDRQAADFFANVPAPATQDQIEKLPWYRDVIQPGA